MNDPRDESTANGAGLPPGNNVPPPLQQPAPPVIQPEDLAPQNYQQQPYQYAQTPYGGYAPPPPPHQKPPKSKSAKIIAAVVGVAGIIVIGIMSFMFLFDTLFGGSIALLEINGQIMGVREHLEFLKRFEQSPNMKVLVIRIDSPGGASAATQELYNEILRVKQVTGKPVLVSMGNTAASGGYYLALAGDAIYANPSTLTGSIGVIASIPNIEELLGKIGYKSRNVKSGEFKDMGEMGREWTDEERALFQSIIDNVYEQFLGDVKAQRGPAIAAAIKSGKLQEEFPGLAEVIALAGPDNDPTEWFTRRVCDGRVFSGEQAVNYGFIDNIGNLPDVIRAAQQIAGLPENAKIVSSHRDPTFFDLLSGSVKSLLGIAGPGHPTLQYRLTM